MIGHPTRGLAQEERRPPAAGATRLAWLNCATCEVIELCAKP